MKNVILGLASSAALLASTSAFAGFYVGGDMGLAHISGHGAGASKSITDGTGTVLTITADSRSQTTYNASVLFGYLFNQYVGMEGAITKYGNGRSDLDIDVDSVTVDQLTIDSQYSSVSLLAKGILPVGSGLDLFLKGGIAIVHQNFNKVFGLSTFGKNNANNFIRPEIAFGISKNMTENWVGSLTVAHIFGKGSIKDAANKDDGSKYLPNITTLSLGIQYNF